MLRRFGFPVGTHVLTLFDRDTGIKVHPSYKAAKSGDAEAEQSVVVVGCNPALIPERKDMRLIKERFQDEFTEIIPDALTANSARYLVGFRSVDAIRDRLAAARQEIDHRLRSKGLSRSGSFT